MERFSYKIVSLAILAAAAFAIYGASLRGEFVYDDKEVIEHNDFIKDLKNIPYLLSPDYFSLAGELSYRPLVTLSYFLDFSLWGLNPFGFRLTNLLVHLLVAFFLVLLAQRLLLSFTAAFIAGLIFIAHPTAVEPAALISYREDLLAGLFLMISLTLRLGNNSEKSTPMAPGRIRGVRLFLSLAAYVAALFSKESAIILLPIMAFYDLLYVRQAPQGVRFRRIFLDYAGYLAISALFLTIRFYIMRNPAEQKLEYFGGSFLAVVMVIPKVLILYAKTILLPSNLNADYDLSIPDRLPFVAFAAAVFLILAVVTFLFKALIRSGLAICFGILWFFVALGPVLNLYPLANIAAERFLYMPMLGFVIAFAACLDKALFYRFPLSRYIPNRFLLPAIILILLIPPYGLISYQRSQVWRSGLSLWSDTVKKSPGKARPHGNYGNAFLRSHNYDKSAFAYQMALFLDEYFSAAHNNLGVIFRNRGYGDKATLAFTRARPLDYGNWKAANNLGLALAKRNSFWAAAVQFQIAVAINPRYGEAFYNLGVAFEKMGRFDKAIAAFHITMGLRPKDPQARYALGVIFLQELRLPARALYHFQRGLALQPAAEMEAVLKTAITASQRAIRN